MLDYNLFLQTHTAFWNILNYQFIGYKGLIHMWFFTLWKLLWSNTPTFSFIMLIRIPSFFFSILPLFHSTPVSGMCMDALAQTCAVWSCVCIWVCAYLFTVCELRREIFLFNNLPDFAQYYRRNLIFYYSKTKCYHFSYLSDM